MQRNKYLDDLNIPIENYGTNFMSDDDPRYKKWNKQREEYGFDSRECWNLDKTFIEWLYSHLMMYKEESSGVINLSHHKFDFEGKEYTQKECIDYILERLKNAIIQRNADIIDYDYESVRDAIRMWAEIYAACWW